MTLAATAAASKSGQGKSPWAARLPLNSRIGYAGSGMPSCSSNTARKTTSTPCWALSRIRKSITVSSSLASDSHCEQCRDRATDRDGNEHDGENGHDEERSTIFLMVRLDVPAEALHADSSL